MAYKSFRVGFPVGGVNRATSYEAQPEGTTPAAENVWPYHYPGGRVMGGVRPPVTSCNYGGGDPYHWCRCVWGGVTSGGATSIGDGIAVVSSSGVRVGTVGTSASRIITFNSRISSSFSSASSVTVLDNILYVADYGKASIHTYDLVSSQSGTLTVGPYPDGSAMGTIPTNCRAICQHMGALFLGGAKEAPHVLYRSAVHEPRNWDYSDPVEGAAWASSGISGEINEPIIALFNHGFGCLLVCHSNSVSVVRGDPQLGGSIIKLSQFSGPVSQSAICKTGSDQTFMLTKEELVAMAPGCGSPAQTVSRFKLPADLAGIEIGGGDSASIAYEGRWGGIIILVKRVQTDATIGYSQFFFDLGNQGFWPMSFGGTVYDLAVSFPQAQLYNRGTSLLLKSGSGKIFNTDATESISGYVWIGPIAVGDGMIDGLLVRLAAVLGESSGEVSFDVHCAESAQEAFNSTAVYSSVWDRAGRSHYDYIRSRCQTAYVKLYASSVSQWALEQLVGDLAMASSAKVIHDAP